MLSDKAKELFGKLELEYAPIAIKYHLVPPANCPKSEKKMAFCQFVKEAQTTLSSFYIDKTNDDCYGKMALGMEPKSPVGASGQAGYDFEMYRSPIAGQQLYQKIEVLVPGTVNYVQFAPVSICDFDPDLIVCVADVEKADILLRASSYISGDLWESKSSPVLSCAWMYAYPIISGKVNHITTGMYHGLKRRKAYPAGLQIIAIPYAKIDEVVTALEQMSWTAIAFREDEESKAEMARRRAGWAAMAEQTNTHFSL